MYKMCIIIIKNLLKDLTSIPSIVAIFIVLGPIFAKR